MVLLPNVEKHMRDYATEQLSNSGFAPGPNTCGSLQGEGSDPYSPPDKLSNNVIVTIISPTIVVAIVANWDNIYRIL